MPTALFELGSILIKKENCIFIFLQQSKQVTQKASLVFFSFFAFKILGNFRTNMSLLYQEPTGLSKNGFTQPLCHREECNTRSNFKHTKVV